MMVQKTRKEAVLSISGKAEERKQESGQMEKTKLKTLTENSLFKERLLRNIFLVSMFIGAFLPLSYIFYIHPAFDRLLTEDKREDAISVARHLSASIHLEIDRLEKDSMPKGLLREAVRQKIDFGLTRLRVFSNSGELILSTDPHDAGRINKESHFYEALVKGIPHAGVVSRHSDYLGGEMAPLDLVETSMPLMKNGKFVGVIQVHYDITALKAKLDQLLFRSLGLLSGLAACLLVVIVWVLHKGNKNIIRRRQAEEVLQEAHDTLEIKVEERTQELRRTNERLQLEIEERKRAEERISESRATLQTVFEGISEPLVMLGEKLDVRMLNRAALQYYGFADYEEIIGKPCHEALKGEPAVCDGCLIPDACTSGSKVVFERKGLFDLDRLEQVVVYPLGEVVGKPRGCVFQINDITDQRNAERQMVRTDRLSSLGQLSGGIAHEIRNPLSGVSLFMDVLFDEDKFKRTDEELEIYKEIKENISKINMIIKRILAFARDSETDSTEIDINSLIRDSLKFWYEKMRTYEIKLELCLDEKARSVFGDPIGLQQVLNNLVQNAIDAMSRGGRLRIATRKGISSLHQNRPVVNVELQDTGMGIKPEQWEKIFDPFFSTKPTGTGLGLAISNQIVQSHGGVLSFATQPGRGTTFIVELPVTSEE